MNIPESRKAHILKKMSAGEAISVSDLSADLKVSEMTIRRDLAELEKEGLLKRVHGGAVSNFARGYEPPFLLRHSQAVIAKSAIGKLAASLVVEGDSVALDVGTTVLEAARHLSGRRGLTIVTPSIRIAQQFTDNKNLRVILAGGIVRAGEESLVGDLACRTFQDFYVDKLFLGVGGINSDAGLTEYNWDDALVKRAMIRSAKEVIAVVDSSKFGRIAFAKIADIKDLHTLITDQNPPANLAESLAAARVKVLVVASDPETAAEDTRTQS